MTDAPRTNTYVGQPLRRREDIKFITGKGRYVDDIGLAGTLHVAFLRSPHAHAQIMRIDFSAARASAGVRLVVGAKQVEGKIGGIRPHWVIPRPQGPVRPRLAVAPRPFRGTCGASVRAETREAAPAAPGL